MSESESGTTWVASEIDVRGLQDIGGTIRLLGHQVGVIGNAYLNASGESGGGEILIGGDYRGENPDIANATDTFIGRDSTIAANALSNGDGGKVIVWADEVTRFLGSISARGGESSGDGGFVETSGKQHLEATGFVDASSGRVSPAPGCWILATPICKLSRRPRWSTTLPTAHSAAATRMCSRQPPTTR